MLEVNEKLFVVTSLDTSTVGVLKIRSRRVIDGATLLAKSF